MITNKTGDLLKAFDKGEINCLLHCSNCFCLMGSGIALAIANKYPAAKEADDKTENGSYAKLGHFSVGSVGTDSDPKYVVNLYAQEGIGCDINDPLTRNCRYDLVYNSLWRLKRRLESNDKFEPRIGIPWQMASDRAGGDWEIVEKIIERVFDGSEIPVTIYKLENA